MGLRVLLIGSGGREAALALKLDASPSVEALYVAPGNGGTVHSIKSENISIKANDYQGLVQFAQKRQVNLVVPGPDQCLVDGIEGYFRAVGIPVFGPSVLAARMEGSKSFSKDFMSRWKIPTASYERFSSFEEAKAYIQTVMGEIVIKADGLAAGKGVLLPKTKQEAITGLESIMIKKEFGTAGNEVVIEEFLQGQELSVLAISDGYTVLPLPPAQDHKAIGEGDTGLNTGGMGTYAPTPIATPELNAKIVKVLQTTIDGMRKEGFPFVGCLFVGFMIGQDGEPKVLEYNVRFGDPETQSVLALLETDLAELLLAAAERRLDSIELNIKPGFAVTVVLAAKGYPGSYSKGKEITFDPLPKDVTVFHAGTDHSNGKLVQTGGRTLNVTATAASLQEAVDLAYKGVACCHFDGMQYRRDIAHRALKASSSSTTTKQGMTYASAGVSIEAGNSLVQQIKKVVKSTSRAGSDSVIGGFGGLFDLKAAGYTDPILVSGTDGVGTKLKVAHSSGTHASIGVDLVAMSVNDLVVQGAEPLYFLDYFACSKLDVGVAAEVVSGIAEGCRQSNCALIGGETAEMPGLYNGDDYDLAGFAVGAVNRDSLLPLPTIKSGDVLLGLASSGPHSNGYSLIRKIVEASGLTYSSQAPWDESTTIGESLLIPTTIYIRQLMPLLHDAQYKGLVKGMSHITGGGFTENIPRMLPASLGAQVAVSAYSMPPVFRWLKREGNVASSEMARAFNCGIGMVLVVEASAVSDIKAKLESSGDSAVCVLGRVQEGEGVQLIGLESWDD